MGRNVFANDLEIACKVADGVSSCAFLTHAGQESGAKVPYANTANAKDTENGSKTVLIGGKQIIKKDVSYFKTSTGNEPSSGRKGQWTGVKKGKAFFTSWSMNVMVEGENVCRHTDYMTHNHASVVGNTGDWIYIDKGYFGGHSCKKELAKVDKACGGTERKPGKYRGRA